QGAIAALEVFLTDYPKDPSAPKIRRWVANLRKEPAKVENPATTPAAVRPAAITDPIAEHSSVPPAELPPKVDWAPPDVDSEKPLVVSGAACSLPRVLKAAGKNAA